MRNVYDRFLAKFPLLFGYWKKYADLEFSIAGTEAAEMVGLPLSIFFRFVANAFSCAGLRARSRQHIYLGRFVDQLLLLQARNQPRLRCYTRVSIRTLVFLPFDRYQRSADFVVGPRKRQLQAYDSLIRVLDAG